MVSQPTVHRWRGVGSMAQVWPVTATNNAGGYSATERPHILIVTHDPQLNTFLAEGLLLGGFWTSTVADAIQTLEVFRLRTFDLMLLDASLPGLGALELIRRLRGRSTRTAPSLPRTDAPIVLIAGGLDEIDPAGAALAGATRVIFAPIELDDIVLQLHALLTSAGA